MRTTISILILLGIAFSAGCQPMPADTAQDPEAPPLSPLQPASPTEPLPTPDRFNQTPTHLPERVPPTEEAVPATGEVPAELLDILKKDLAQRTGAAPDSILVLQGQSTIWNDGSLGCPQPDVFYTQALVNGFWVLLEVDGTTYDYRASESGYFILCENGLPPFAPPAGTPDS